MLFKGYYISNAHGESGNKPSQIGLLICYSFKSNQLQIHYVVFMFTAVLFGKTITWGGALSHPLIRQ